MTYVRKCRRKYKEPKTPPDTRWCRGCKKIHGFHLKYITKSGTKIYADDQDRKWTGRYCWECFIDRNRVRLRAYNKKWYYKDKLRRSEAMKKIEIGCQQPRNEIFPLFFV